MAMCFDRVQFNFGTHIRVRCWLAPIAAAAAAAAAVTVLHAACGCNCGLLCDFVQLWTQFFCRRNLAFDCDLFVVSKTVLL